MRLPSYSKKPATMSAAKRMRVDEYSMPEAQGYVHSVSPIKMSRNNNRYFNAVFQENDKYSDVVCFVPEMNAKLADLEKSRSPVSLTNISKAVNTRKPGCYDIKLTSSARISVPARQLQFRFEEPEKQQLMCIEDVKSLNAYQKVTVEGKILHLGDAADQKLKSGATMKKIYATIGDASDSIQICIWGQAIADLQLAKCLRFANVSVRNFDCVKSLTTSPDSSLEEIDDIGFVKNVDTELISLTETITVDTVSCMSSTLCSSCSRDVGTFNKDVPTIKCTHCQMRQRTTSLITTLKVSVKCKLESNEPSKFNIPYAVLQNCAFTKDITSADDMEDFFLSMNEFVVEMTPSRTQILSIKDAY